VLPPRILEAFRLVPEEMIGLCRPHAGTALTTPPQPGMRSIRDVLVHMVGAERYRIRHVTHGDPRERLRPEAFPDLDSLLRAWIPQRSATVEFLEGAGPRRAERRAFPWDAAQSASLEEIIWHVVTHAQYHRGQR